MVDGDYKKLLQIWDLDVDDVESKTSKPSNGVRLDHLQIAPLPNATESILCDSCYAHNTSDVNWCIECGTAIISRASFISTTNINEASRIPTKNISDSTSSPVRSDDYTVLPKRHQETTKRHWVTSKHYAWRKPRSRIPSNSESNFSVLSLDLHNFSDYKDLCDYKIKELPIFHREDESSGHYILNCPSEILLQIFSHLDHSVLIICMLVCRTFYCIASDYSLWKEITLQRIRRIDRNILQQVASRNPNHLKIIDCQGSLEACDVILFFEKAGENLQSLSIEMSKFGAHICDIMLLNAASHCVNLKSVSIDWVPVSEKTITKMIQYCRSLEELSIKHPSISCSALEVLFLFHHDRLRILNLESTSVTDIIAAIGKNRLKVMEYFASFFNMMDGDIIKKMSYLLPNLNSLHVYCTSNSTVLMPEAVQELLNISLKVLYFRLFERNSCDIVSCSLLSQFPTLRHLGIDCVCDEQLEILCQGILQLETLDLSGSFVTDYSFSIILSSSFFSSLNLLRMNNCDGINDAALQKTVQSFSNNSCKSTTMAEDICLFICSCPSLRIIELRGIHCAPDVQVLLHSKNCLILH